MSSYKPEQRRLLCRGREFHFVSYEARAASERRGESALPPMWFLMNEGKRCPVMAHVIGQESSETDRALLRWVEKEVFGSAPGNGKAREQ